jgi:tRNA nucleotidyltransferase (CCA-adding enzyme)
METRIPVEADKIIQALQKEGFEAYAVGGCVRDTLRGVKPKDWDVTTNAKPEEVQKIFPDSFYENDFGTVGVKTGSEDPTLAVVEVTTFRIEEAYSDRRHPDAVKFAETLEEDLARRDFTINAMALTPQPEFKIVDPYGGQKDLEKKIIRAVGEAEKRFDEDALRLMRAVRFVSQLGFEIESATLEAIKKNSRWITRISNERIRDEFEKLIMGDFAVEGVTLMEQTGLMKAVLPELQEGVGVAQNLHHIYSVWEHNLRALGYSVRKKYDLTVRLASLLHDVGKPRSKRGEGRNSTFYGHEVIGGRMTEDILNRLRFPKKIVEKVTLLVRYHLFYYNVGEVTESSVRRLLKNVGPENMEDLVKVREADRIGSGVPKAVPYKLRHFKYMVEKVSKDPISAKMLAIDGNDLMKLLEITPGPKVGLILNALLGEVLEDPKKNTAEYLTSRAKEFDKQSAEELKKYLDMKEKKIEEEETATRKKYYV